MNKKSDTATIVASVLAATVAGITIYALIKTFDAVRRFDDIDLDLSNDIGLSSMFNNKDNK